MRKAAVLILTLLLLAAAPFLCAAAAEEEESIPTGVMDAQTSAAITQQDAEAAEPVSAASASPYTAEFALGDTRTLHGIFSNVQHYFRIPDYCVPESLTLRCSYECSELILKRISSLTFSLNGTPFYSCPLDGANVLSLTVPISLIKEGYNLLEIDSYVRLTDDENCVDDYAGANWINLDGSTSLTLGFRLSEDAGLLRQYPYPLLSLMDTTGENCAVAVSDEAADAELEAALIALGGLGASVQSPNEILLSPFSAQDREHVLYFGLYDNTSADLLKLLEGEEPADGQAIIRRAQANGRDIIIVTSRSGDALTEAARLLSNSARVKQLATETERVSEGATAALAQSVSDGTLSGLYSLDQILGHGMSFVGPFDQRATITLPVSSDYTLPVQSKISLNMRYSENLDFNRSLVSVYWGSDTPIASKRLTREGAYGDTLVFTIPADLVGKSGNTLTIAFDLEIQDLFCTPRQEEMPWAYITGDSTLYLPEGAYGLERLNHLPAPFQRENAFNDVLCLVSNSPAGSELTLLGRVATVLGSGTNGAGTLKVKRISEFNAETDGNMNLLVVGDSARHPGVMMFNSLLYLQYNEDGTALTSSALQTFSEAYASTVGAVQLIASPYAEERSILVVSSSSSEGLSRLVSLWSQERLRWYFSGSALVIDDKLNVTTYTPAEETKKEEEQKPSLIEVVNSNRSPLLFVLIAAGSMALLLVVAVVLVSRAYKRKK